MANDQTERLARIAFTTYEKWSAQNEKRKRRPWEALDKREQAIWFGVALDVLDERGWAA